MYVNLKNCLCFEGTVSVSYLRLESPVAVLLVESEMELSWSANEDGAPAVSDFPSGPVSGRRRRTRRRRERGRGRRGRGMGKGRRRRKMRRRGRVREMISMCINIHM